MTPVRLGRMAAAVTALLLAACASPVPLLADQAMRVPAERNASISCASFVSLLYGSVTSILIVLDRGVLQPGSISVTADCAASIKAAP
jgi:hypothetical protein